MLIYDAAAHHVYIEVRVLPVESKWQTGCKHVAFFLTILATHHLKASSTNENCCHLFLHPTQYAATTKQTIQLLCTNINEPQCLKDQIK